MMFTYWTQAPASSSVATFFYKGDHPGLVDMVRVSEAFGTGATHYKSKWHKIAPPFTKIRCSETLDSV